MRTGETEIRAPCGDCGERIDLRIEGGELRPSEDVIHVAFAEPGERWLYCYPDEKFARY